MPTAEEWLNKHALECIEKNCADINELKCIMIHFAREHVEAALKKASEKAEWKGYTLAAVEICDYSILDAYPLENIK